MAKKNNTGASGEVLTYKNNADYFDGTAVYHNNPKYNDQIRQRVYSGKYGYNPTTGALIKLDKENQVKVSEETKKLSKPTPQFTEEQERAIQASHQKNLKDVRNTGKWWEDPNYEPSQEELESFSKMGVDMTVNNPVFKGAAAFTPIGAPLAMLEGLSNITPNLQQGNYGQATFNALEMLPFIPKIGKESTALLKSFSKYKPLNNTYKLNPLSNKLNDSNISYRATKGDAAYKDYLKSGVVKQPDYNKMSKPLNGGFDITNRPTAWPSFKQGEVLTEYGDDAGTIFATDLPVKNFKGRHGKADFAYDPETNIRLTEIPNENITGVYSAKPHWWKGYQPLGKGVKFSHGGKINNNKELIEKFNNYFSTPRTIK